MGKDLSWWLSIPNYEQEYWLDYEADRIEGIAQFVHQLTEKQLNTPEAIAIIRSALDLD